MPVTQKTPGTSGCSAAQSALVWHSPQVPTWAPPHRVSAFSETKQRHDPPQPVGPPVHELTPSAQTPWPVTHTCWAQISPTPQSVDRQHWAVVGMHVPWQSTVPLGQTQVPFTHPLPPRHAPQLPPHPLSPQALLVQSGVQIGGGGGGEGEGDFSSSTRRGATPSRLLARPESSPRERHRREGAGKRIKRLASTVDHPSRHRARCRGSEPAAKQRGGQTIGVRKDCLWPQCRAHG